MLPPAEDQLEKPHNIGRRAQQPPTGMNPSSPVRWWRSRTFLVIVRILLFLAVLALIFFLGFYFRQTFAPNRPYEIEIPANRE